MEPGEALGRWQRLIEDALMEMRIGDQLGAVLTLDKLRMEVFVARISGNLFGQPSGVSDLGPSMPSANAMAKGAGLYDCPKSLRSTGSG